MQKDFPVSNLLRLAHRVCISVWCDPLGVITHITQSCDNHTNVWSDHKIPFKPLIKNIYCSQSQSHASSEAHFLRHVASHLFRRVLWHWDGHARRPCERFWRAYRSAPSAIFWRRKWWAWQGLNLWPLRCQRKVQYLNKYLKYLYLFVLMKLRNHNLRLSLLNPYTSLLSGRSSSSAATAFSACT